MFQSEPEPFELDARAELAPPVTPALRRPPRWRAALRAQRDDGVSATPDPWGAFARELERSRRFGRSFALVSARLESEGVREVRRLVRSIDWVWVDRRRVYVMLPEADRATGFGLLARIEAEAPGVLGREARIVAFPEDGLTSGALLAALGRPQSRAAANGEALRGSGDGLWEALSGARRLHSASRAELDASRPLEGRLH